MAEARPSLTVGPGQPAADLLALSAAALAAASAALASAGQPIAGALPAAEALYRAAQSAQGSYVDAVPAVTSRRVRWPACPCLGAPAGTHAGVPRALFQPIPSPPRPMDVVYDSPACSCASLNSWCTDTALFLDSHKPHVSGGPCRSCPRVAAGVAHGTDGHVAGLADLHNPTPDPV